ncbi:MAG: hypothetical protein EPO22_13545 [Dehalococcoidia bacterium]|nr:MAG: hypothetical protein EPO22_13545 [Dehalococcoidia bacterium]
MAIAALIGAALASGIMWYMMVSEGVDYTRASWYAIPVVWGYMLVALWASVEHRLLGGGALLLAAYLASAFFADVYGYLPGAVAAVAALRSIRAGLFRPNPAYQTRIGGRQRA